MSHYKNSWSGGDMTRLLITLLLSVTITTTAFAEWSGPVEVVKSSWGINPEQVAIGRGDSVDEFPREFGVDSDGNIAIGDRIQNKIKIFSSKGLLKREISRPINRMLWPSSIVVGRKSCVVVAYTDFTHVFDMNTGELVTALENMGGGRYVNADCSEITTRTSSSSGPIWRTYSATGETLRESELKPKSFGRVSQKKKAVGKYEITVDFPDKQWMAIRDEEFLNPSIDTYGNLYLIKDSKQVFEVDSNGNEIASLSIPKSKVEQKSRGQGVEPEVIYHEEYGEVHLAPNGDAYTWKRTPTTYSIIKWTRK